MIWRARTAVFVLVAAALAAVGGEAAAGSPQRGKKIYDEHCTRCHGSDGVPVMFGVPSFYKGERLERPDGWLINSVKKGKGVMPAWGGLLNAAQLQDVVSYLRLLRK